MVSETKKKFRLGLSGYILLNPLPILSFPPVGSLVWPWASACEVYYQWCASL